MGKRYIEDKISVIIPVYNGEKFIASCIDSVLTQTYKNFEVIIVDDGSVDTTLEIIKEYAQREDCIKYVHTENGGVCHARNTGIEMATGDYITFLDADDRLRADALEVMYNLLQNNEADMAIVRKWFSSRGAKIEAEENCKEEVFVWTQEEAMTKMVDDHYSMHTVTAKLFKREVLHNVRFVTGRKVHEDNFFVFECLPKCNRIVFQNNKVYFGFVVPGSASRSAFSEKFFDILYFAERKATVIKAAFPALQNKIPLIYTRARCSLLFNLCKTYDKKYRKTEKECLRIIRKNMPMLTPVSEFEKRFYFAIRFRLFWLYKLYIYMRGKRYF